MHCEKTSNYMQNLSQNQELNISAKTSTQAEDYFPIKHTINDEDLNLMVKNFIRLTLALEHTRTPIKREDIAKKVLLPSHSRSFAVVFKKTQEKLRNIFGMELVELPCKNRYKHMSTFKNENSELYCICQKPDTGCWMIACDGCDNWYHGECVKISKIDEELLDKYFSGKFQKKYLSHLQIDNDLSTENLDKTLREMVKKGYIERIEEDTASINEKEKTYTYFLGQRGKTEIDSQGLATFVEKIHGDTSQHLKQIVEELFKKSISNES
ncbi:hypothetical protein PCK2_000069 [Pneumocystis canis]|nr:hypothetical protein PCK2_000069 [Pneumocystis canis]